MSQPNVLRAIVGSALYVTLCGLFAFAVTSQDGAFGCGGWTARRDGDRLELTGAGERIDGLRALCAAAWAATEGSPTRESVRSAIQRLYRTR